MFKNDTIAIIKTAVLTIAGMTSMFIYGSMVTEYVISKTETFFD